MEDDNQGAPKFQLEGEGKRRVTKGKGREKEERRRGRVKKREGRGGEGRSGGRRRERQEMKGIPWQHTGIMNIRPHFVQLGGPQKSPAGPPVGQAAVPTARGWHQVLE